MLRYERMKESVLKDINVLRNDWRQDRQGSTDWKIWFGAYMGY